MEAADFVSFDRLTFYHGYMFDFYIVYIYSSSACKSFSDLCDETKYISTLWCFAESSVNSRCSATLNTEKHYFPAPSNP